MDDRPTHSPGPERVERSALLPAAAAAGHEARVRELLAWSGPVSPEDAELLVWAADYGAYIVVHELLGGETPSWADLASKETVEQALGIARGWVGLDPVAELRRRLGDASAVVDRETVEIDEFDGTHAVRIRVTGADGRWAEVQTVHLAIVTYLEERLGIVVSRDALLARALRDRDPDSADWMQSWFSALGPDAEEAARWAVALLADPDRDVRRFAVDVLHSLSFDESPDRDVLAALRDRLPAEPDADVLSYLIQAFANYHERGRMPEIIAHAGHAEPAVRGSVASALGWALMEPSSTEEAVAVLAALGRDHDGGVRTNALISLRYHAFDHPATAKLLAAGRDDPDSRVRLEAFAGLAQSGDTAAHAELQRLADEAGEPSRAASLASDAARLRSATPPGVPEVALGRQPPVPEVGAQGAERVPGAGVVEV